MKFWNKAWSRWKIIGGVVADYQARTITLLFYYTIMVPFGLGVRLFSDPLCLKDDVRSAAWLPRQEIGDQLNDVRRQF